MKMGVSLGVWSSGLSDLSIITIRWDYWSFLTCTCRTFELRCGETECARRGIVVVIFNNGATILIASNSPLPPIFVITQRQGQRWAPGHKPLVSTIWSKRRDCRVRIFWKFKRVRNFLNEFIHIPGYFDTTDISLLILFVNVLQWELNTDRYSCLGP